MIGWWRRWRTERILRKRPIPDALWALTVARHPFLARRSAPTLSRLRELATLFLAHKEFTGAHGLVVTDEMAVAIAAQACLPVLHFGLEAYADMVGIVVQPGEVVAPREHVDEAGVVHHYEEWLSGEAMPGGPVMLSWADVADAGESAAWAYNVVIHEFVHVLDMAAGHADGLPPMPDAALARRWQAELPAAYDRLCAQLDRGRDTFLDPYAAEGLEEFFPVAAEAFFVHPHGLRQDDPALYDLLRSYFRQDPITESPA